MKITHILRPVITCAVITATTACSTTNVLFDRSGYTIPAMPDDTAQLLQTAQNTRVEYQRRANELEDSNWFFDIPLFAAAIGAVAALYYDAHTDLIAGIGIGAGAVTLSRTALAPTSRATGYSLGAKAMSCVYRSGGGYLNSGDDLKQLKEDLKTLDEEISAYEQLPPYSAPEKTPASQATLLEQTNAQLKKAYETALETRLLGKKEMTAGQMGNRTLTSALMDIEDQVKTLVKLRPFDFGQAITDLNSSIASATTQQVSKAKAQQSAASLPTGSGQVQTSGSDPVLNEINTRRALAESLARATRTILDRERSYVAVEAQVKACPARAVATTT